MPVSREFHDYVLEQLEGFAPVAARPMFGGYGLYAGGVMFAVLDDDEMFLRAAEATREEFTAAGSRPFAPIPGVKPMLGYWLVPGDVLEDRALLPRWAERARLAALAAQKTPARKTARKVKARR